MKLDEFDLYIHSSIEEKLKNKKPPVTRLEVEEAFHNCDGVFIEETREDHKTKPPTYWFISETSDDRILKICFIAHMDDKVIVLKTAFDADNWEIEEYENYK